MHKLTFGIEANLPKTLIAMAQEKIDYFESLLSETKNEITYLESEASAISSFIQYHEIQTEREEVLLGVFRINGEYGEKINIPSSDIDSAISRLNELESRKNTYTQRRDKLTKKLEFLQNDIELLKNMLKSSPRPWITEMGAPPHI